jgi:hypothetical protein
VTPCLAEACDPTSLLVSRVDLGGADGTGQPGRVTALTSQGARLLHVGGSTACRTQVRHEWLLDVSVPGTPVEILGEARESVDAESFDYWSWYYPGNATGWSSFIAPFDATVADTLIVRSAYSFFDLHEWTPAEAPVDRCGTIVDAGAGADAGGMGADASPAVVGDASGRDAGVGVGTAPTPLGGCACRAHPGSGRSAAPLLGLIVLARWLRHRRAAWASSHRRDRRRTVAR